jgi:methionyl-tRNA formyltransferase
VQKRHEKWQSAYRRVLFPNGDDGKMPRRDLIRIVPSHNGKACLKILQELKPDIIVVYGTLVIKGDVIAAAGTSILNMHTGLSPRYRGSDTIFWPLYNNEPEWVGVTVHRLDLGIDAGPILATAKPAMSADDDEAVLFAKCVKVGCEYLKSAIRDEYNGTANATPQQLDKGREYRGVERTVAAERRVEALLREGLLAKYLSQNLQ